MNRDCFAYFSQSQNIYEAYLRGRQKAYTSVNKWRLK